MIASLNCFVARITVDGTEREQRARIFPSQEAVSIRFIPHITNGSIPKEQGRKELYLFDTGNWESKNSPSEVKLRSSDAFSSSGTFFQLSEKLLLSPTHSENPPYPNITNHSH